ncbi:hypothetical protein [Desulfocicer vacuolatum]|uniref:hypothetical protein n=1 Tax=Desulfocicer vacuolatum TaxID=2298 RepID=UPI001BAF1C10|nr:hypothetical protein [Desulfocicer vacuolatum]
MKYSANRGGISSLVVGRARSSTVCPWQLLKGRCVTYTHEISSFNPVSLIYRKNYCLISNFTRYRLLNDKAWMKIIDPLPSMII